jgi:hypothetical protein
MNHGIPSFRPKLSWRKTRKERIGENRHRSKSLCILTKGVTIKPQIKHEIRQNCSSKQESPYTVLLAASRMTSKLQIRSGYYHVCLTGMQIPICQMSRIQKIRVEMKLIQFNSIVKGLVVVVHEEG